MSEITEVKIKKIDTDMRAKAMATVVLDNEYAIHEIRIIEDRNDKNKTFIAFPSRKDPNGKFRDIVHPINQTVREKITEAILEEYAKIK